MASMKSPEMECGRYTGVCALERCDEGTAISAHLEEAWLDGEPVDELPQAVQHRLEDKAYDWFIEYVAAERSRRPR